MSAELIYALLRKREELLAQVQDQQSAIFHLDQGLALSATIRASWPATALMVS